MHGPDRYGPCLSTSLPIINGAKRLMGVEDGWGADRLNFNQIISPVLAHILGLCFIP